MQKRSTDATRQARRRFPENVPAAVVAGLAAPAIATADAGTAAHQQGRLDCAEKVFGIDFTDADEEQALAGVNRNLASFEQLRKIDIPLDTEPAMTFRPVPARQEAEAWRHAERQDESDHCSRPAARRSSLDDLAFLPVDRPRAARAASATSPRPS